MTERLRRRAISLTARFEELIPDSTVRLLDGCGHAITEDCADEVSEHMAAFLR